MLTSLLMLLSRLKRDFPHRRSLSLITLALAAGVTIAACGSSAPALTPSQQLTRTFKASSHIVSGDISLAIDLRLNGIKQLRGQPIAITVTGPFEKSVGADLKITVSAVDSTGDLGFDIVNKKLYLGLANTFYSLPASALKSALANSGISGTSTLNTTKIPTSTTSAKNELSKLGINPRTWITGWKDLGTTSIGGVSSEHLRGEIDIGKVLRAFETAVNKSNSANNSISTASGLAIIKSAITEAHVDLYIGDADHIIRAVDVDLAFTVPALIKAQAGGLTSGSLTADLTLTGVNQPQKVTAPPHPQPASGILKGVAALEKQLRPALNLLSSAIAPATSIPALQTPSSSSLLQQQEYTAYLDVKAATVTASNTANHFNTSYPTGPKLVAEIVSADPELRAVVNDKAVGSEPAGTFTVAASTPKAFKTVGKTLNGDTVTYSVGANGSSSVSGSLTSTPST